MFNFFKYSVIKYRLIFITDGFAAGLHLGFHLSTHLVGALELFRRGLVPGSATQVGEVNLLVSTGYHSCVFLSCSFLVYSYGISVIESFF